MNPRTAASMLRQRTAGNLLRAEQAATTAGRHSCLRSRHAQQQKRWNTPAPKAGDGPLMSRRADRQLPDVSQVGFRWGRTLPLFAVLVAASSLAIFNYQKSSSPVISSTLYALRTSPRARAALGDEVYFKHSIPWISGEINQVQGRIDVRFSVRGSRGTAVMRFASRRPGSRALFETSEWSLRTEDGTWIDLLEDGDPFGTLLADEGMEAAAAAAAAAEPLVEEPVQRGFRQQGALNK
ncbi:Cytochrome oxidase assembly protein 1 [Cordyceps fumosorosea ARSEF 2679]|uniref:Cytochrome oxidase assembly protein 1 n=1 Tax=Cordyceps fumosorosea (strain ARSEF 2679) TaxID=1081104 RepID=A0A168CCP5_CORFA|nr:Cytochrome oxidase assembly protein 1 [Cordyceps fumosorosea ARSEF 2679]OAA71230.1 Cytochrome oxidase assembly protein 1 [Cordyceps fumosorosea ARSEF 2679]